MIYAFGDYELDIYRYELRRSGEPLHIEPKVFDLLSILIQHHGNFISKDELHAHLWPDQFVSESALSYYLAVARKAIGDTGRAQRLIKTIYTRGYCFIASVEERAREVTPSTKAPERPPLAAPPRPIKTPLAPSLESGESGQEKITPALEILSPEADRRQLTILWCRMTLMSLDSEPLEPEDLYKITQEADTLCDTIIQRFDGYVAQHFGDSIMLYFGYPQAHEDDARRAVNTALKIVRTLRQLSVRLEQSQRIQLTTRVGIHTGLAMVGVVGSPEHRRPVALGNTPHIATQLCELGEPNTVIMSQSTQQLVEGYIVGQALGDYLLEGEIEYIQAYHALRESNTQNRLEVAALSGLTPFIGREQEIQLLYERWLQAKRGMGQVILLSGEAGIGKSRLSRMFMERMAREPYTQIEYRCSPYYRNSSLYPIVAHLHQQLQLQHATSPEAKLIKLEQALSAVNLDLEMTVPIFTRLFDLPLPAQYQPLNLSPAQQKQRTLSAILSWLLKEIEPQPMCIIMEDLHWADPSTLDLLSLLIDQALTTHLLVVLTSRPSFQPPWAARSHFTHIAISRLDPAQTKAMISQVTNGKALPDGILQQLLLQTDGVPLFVEEMTRMVLETGLVKEKEDAYELAGPLSPLSIPATLYESLMARLDRLDTGKIVAQLGATLGREFPYELIQAVSPMDEDTLQAELARLVNAELLYQQGLPPQAHYLFKHALIQEAAYQSLLRSTRQQYHRHIAQILEERFSEIREMQPEILAQHCAGANLPHQAIAYWQRASQNAMERSAYVEAVAHLEQGLTLLASLPDASAHQSIERELQMARGVALIVTKGYASQDVEQAYLQARALCAKDTDIPQQFTIIRGLWLCYLVRGQLPKAIELGKQLFQLAQHSQDATLLMESHRILGSSLLMLGELDSAWTHLEQGTQLYDIEQHKMLTLQYGQDSGTAHLGYAAWSLWLRGYPDQALQTLDKALNLAQQLEHPYSQGFALTFAAWLHQWRREPETVLERTKAVVALAQRYDFPLLSAHGVILRGWALAELGQTTSGIELLQQGLADYQATGTRLAQAFLMSLLAEALTKSGRSQEGLGVLLNAQASVDQNGERWWEAELYRLRAELLLQQPRPNMSEIEDMLQKALGIARSQQAKSLELRATLSLCQLRQQQGNPHRDWRLLKEIYEWFTEGFDTPALIAAKTFLERLP